MIWFLFNNDAVPLIQSNFWYERILCITTDRIWNSQTTILIESNFRNSVSMLATMPLSTVPFEGKHTGPSLSPFTPNIGVNNQIKTDTKYWTPDVNGSNLFVFLNLFFITCKIIKNLRKGTQSMRKSIWISKLSVKVSCTKWRNSKWHIVLSQMNNIGKFFYSVTLTSWDYSSWVCSTWGCCISFCIKQFQV